MQKMSWLVTALVGSVILPVVAQEPPTIGTHPEEALLLQIIGMYRYEVDALMRESHKKWEERILNPDRKIRLEAVQFLKERAQSANLDLIVKAMADDDATVSAEAFVGFQRYFESADQSVLTRLENGPELWGPNLVNLSRLRDAKALEVLYRLTGGIDEKKKAQAEKMLECLRQRLQAAKIRLHEGEGEGGTKEMKGKAWIMTDPRSSASYSALVSTATGREVQRRHIGGKLTQVSYSPDGKYLAVGSESDWSSQPIGPNPKRPPVADDLQPGGVARSYRYGKVSLFNAATGQFYGEREVGPVTALSWSADSMTVYFKAGANTKVNSGNPKQP